MKVSFCTTCKGRVGFLKHVLPANIVNNPSAEFILVDYSSEDGLEEWIKAEMWNHVESGALTVYRANGLRHFIHAHAKNLAHLLATGDIVCNLDADNFAAKGFTEFLVSVFAEHEHCYARPLKGGGRIALTRENFVRYGGYDESFMFGWGAEDNDLGDRLERAMPWVAIPEEFNERLEHDCAIRAEFTATTGIKMSNEVHRRLSIENLINDRLTVNMHRVWGWWPHLVRNYQEPVTAPFHSHS